MRAAIGWVSCFVALFGGVAWGELLNVEELPLSTSQAYVFTAPLQNGAPPRLFVLDGQLLRIYRFRDADGPFTLTLPPRTAALDIADVDRDGQFEIVAIVGELVMRHPLPPMPENPQWEVLLERRNAYSNAVSQPFPHVLVVPRSESAALALPVENGFEYWSPEGALLDTVPYELDGSEGAVETTPFVVNARSASFAGVGTGLSHALVSRLDTLAPDAPDGAGGLESPDIVRHSPFGPDDISELPIESWPRFVISDSEETTVRAFFAPVPPQFQDSFIRVQGATNSSSEIGPRRRYPGRPLTGGGVQPDFNADGYVDLLMWKSLPNRFSLSVFVRAAQRATWPAQLTVHQFEPETGLYASESESAVLIHLPIPWFNWNRADSPIRHLRIHDFNRDGSSDFGLATARDRYAIWLYRGGFVSEPDWEVRLPGPLESVAQILTLNANGQQALVFRGMRSLYVVRLP